MESVEIQMEIYESKTINMEYVRIYVDVYRSNPRNELGFLGETCLELLSTHMECIRIMHNLGK